LNSSNPGPKKSNAKEFTNKGYATLSIMIILIPISIGFYFNVVIHDKYLELKEGDIPNLQI